MFALLTYFLFPHNCSWNMMMSCWDAQPKQRPKFAILVKVLSDLLDSESNYLKLK